MESISLYEKLEEYLIWMESEEKSVATRNQYRRFIRNFICFLGKRELNKEFLLAYKEKLEEEYQPTSVNVNLAAINGFLAFIGKKELHLKLLKIQKKVYCSDNQELTKAEYLRLVQTAEKNENKKLSLLLQTICGTGIRVSELQYITIEAVKKGEVSIRLKGKNRTILIPGKLKKKLNDFCRHENIHEGSVFVTRTGKALDRSNIWRMMKKLCEDANVDKNKVFPHNLRHLFARTFYSLDKDIAKLADILGHSNINTTRIYILTTSQEHLKRMDALGLVL